jgi:hypothetical protein
VRRDVDVVGDGRGDGAVCGAELQQVHAVERVLAHLEEYTQAVCAGDVVRGEAGGVAALDGVPAAGDADGGEDGGEGRGEGGRGREGVGWRVCECVCVCVDEDRQREGVDVGDDEDVGGAGLGGVAPHASDGGEDGESVCVDRPLPSAHGGELAHGRVFDGGREGHADARASVGVVGVVPEGGEAVERGRAGERGGVEEGGERDVGGGAGRGGGEERDHVGGDGPWEGYDAREEGQEAAVAGLCCGGGGPERDDVVAVESEAQREGLRGGGGAGDEEDRWRGGEGVVGGVDWRVAC